MSWGPKRSSKNPPVQYNPAKERRTNIDLVMEKAAGSFYRNPDPDVTLDSAESSLRDSLANESEYQVGFNQFGNGRNDPQHNDLVEKLSMLKFGDEKNVESFNNGSERDSVLARNTPTDNIFHRTVQPLTESSYSLILAGGFNEKDDLENVDGEASLLNIAIRESVDNKSSGDDGSQDRSLNRESNRFIDSLELEREKRSNMERDSLENCARYAGRDENAGDRRNSGSGFGGTKNRGKSRKPIVISNETVDFDLKLLKARGIEGSPLYNGEENFISKDKNDNIRRDFDNTDSRGELKYMSLPTDSEQEIMADFKTPKTAAIRYVVNSCKSTPLIGEKADNFGRDFINDVESIFRNGENGNGNDGQQSVLENGETNCCRKKVLKRYSQRFAEAPIKFTEQLINLMDESILRSKDECNMNTSGVNLSRLTEEFRKICTKWIEDESMPDFGVSSLQVSSFRSQSLMETHEEKEAEEGVETKSGFASLGGGKKVYRKTPRRILKSCSSPNCANIMHRVEKRGLDVTRYCEKTGGTLDNTETFEFWENLCLEMSPTKQARFHPPSLDDSTTLSHEDFLRRSDRQMAALNQSCQSPGKFEEKGNSISKCLRSCGNDASNIGIRKSNGVENFNEISDIMAARIVDKRRKCFEEAGKVSRGVKNETVLNTNVKNESSPTATDHEAVFLSTISACVEYFDHIKNLKDNRHSLQCIIECSEESIKSFEDNSVQCVEAFIMPLRNSGKQSGDFENEKKKTKLVAEAYLDLSAAPGTPEASLESIESIERLSPNQRTSLGGARSPSVLSKKIKRSISPIQRRVLRTVKPASHSNVPRTPISISKREEISDKKPKTGSGLSAAKSSPHSASNNKFSTNSSSLMDVTNIRNSFDVPKVFVSNPTPPIRDSDKKAANRIGKADENTEFDCKRELKFSATSTTTTPTDKTKKFFYTPGKTPTKSTATPRPKKRYFETPRQYTGQNRPIANNNSPSPGSYRLNYNTVSSPVGMYIRGTNPNLITNVRGKTNERMLTPRATKTPRSKSRDVSPILARSPRLSPKRTETSRLKFQLSSARKQQRAPDILNVAICESNPANKKTETEGVSNHHSPFPKIFYKPAPAVKMVNETSSTKRGGQKIFSNTMQQQQEKIIYRHEGRLNSGMKINEEQNPISDSSTKSSLSSVSGDVSLWHKRPAAKTNYLLKK